MEGLAQILTSLGVSAPAGFNAYLALLLVGIAGRAQWIALTPPYDFLQSWPALAVLTVLLTVEIFVDKIPAVDSINDLLGTLIRPASGAVLFAGTNQALTDSNAAVSLLLGALSAGTLHAFKAGTRPVWTASTGGLGNMVVSIYEDLVAGATVLLAIFAPVLALVMLLLVVALAAVLLVRLRRGLRRRLGTVR